MPCAALGAGNSLSAHPSSGNWAPGADPACLGSEQEAGPVSAVRSEGKYSCTVHFFANLTLSAWLAAQHFAFCGGNNTGAAIAFQLVFVG